MAAHVTQSEQAQPRFWVESTPAEKFESPTVVEIPVAEITPEDDWPLIIPEIVEAEPPLIRSESTQLAVDQAGVVNCISLLVELAQLQDDLVCDAVESLKLHDQMNEATIYFRQRQSHLKMYRALVRSMGMYADSDPLAAQMLSLLRKLVPQEVRDL